MDGVPAPVDKGITGGLGNGAIERMADGGTNLELLDIDGDLSGRVGFDGLAELADLVGSERNAGHAEGG